jgi:hypothetical protein
MPTTPFPAPAKGMPLAALDLLRARIFCLTAHGGLTGAPQVNLPGANVDGLPAGLSIVGRRRAWQRRRPGGRGDRDGGEPMIDVTPNRPEAVAEVHELFERDEQALIASAC